ncbi:hypothetical protein TNCV_4550621 [Trichonephila clavipes]|nr:hypothetical protein TNCV_4550621 [Trichonephila clavipes]
MYKVLKKTVELDCPVVLLEEFIAVDGDNVCTAPMMADKGILSLLKAQKISTAHSIQSIFPSPFGVKNSSIAHTSLLWITFSQRKHDTSQGLADALSAGFNIKESTGRNNALLGTIFVVDVITPSPHPNEIFKGKEGRFPLAVKWYIIRGNFISNF